MNNAKIFRKNLKLTQAQLSERSGISRVTISRIENGIHNPSFGVLTKLAAVLNCTLDELLNSDAGKTA